MLRFTKMLIIRATNAVTKFFAKIFIKYQKEHPPKPGDVKKEALEELDRGFRFDPMPGIKLLILIAAVCVLLYFMLRAVLWFMGL